MNLNPSNIGHLAAKDPQTHRFLMEVTRVVNSLGGATSQSPQTSQSSQVVSAWMPSASASPAITQISESQVTNLLTDLNALKTAMTYQGVWNANTNSPSLVSGTGNKGNLYKVSIAGTTTIDGISQWNVGDMIVFNGAVWDKIDGLASEIVSVFGRVGTVTAQTGDYAVAQVTGAAPIASPTFTGTVGGITAAMVGAPAGSGTSTGTNTGDQTNISGTAGNITGVAAIVNGGTGQTTAQLGIDALSAVSGATNEYVLTKDTATGHAIYKIAPNNSLAATLAWMA
jgi:hypothetical protein